MPLKAGKGQPLDRQNRQLRAILNYLDKESGSGEFEHRRDAVGLRFLDARPAVGPELFERTEARLIRHARRPFYPVAEIDIGQRGARWTWSAMI